jgi:hypothetical protein
MLPSLKLGRRHANPPVSEFSAFSVVGFLDLEHLAFGVLIAVADALGDKPDSHSSLGRFGTV